MSTTHWVLVILWSLVFILGGILALIWFTGWAVNGGRINRHGSKNASNSKDWTRTREAKETKAEEEEDQEVEV